MNSANRIGTEPVIESTAVGASSYVLTEPIALEYKTNNYSLSYWFETWGADAEYDLLYEVSNDTGTSKNWYRNTTLLVDGQTTTGSTYYVTGATKANPCVVSGTHGMSTGDYVVFSGFDAQDSEWAALQDISYYVTSLTSGTLSIDVDTSEFTDELPGTVSGTGIQHKLTFANISSPVLAKYIRFKVEEKAGNAGTVTLRVVTQ